MFYPDDHTHGSRPGPATSNLLLNGGELASLLCSAVERQDWLDAYLLAAGLNQIAEDFTHRDVLFLGAIGDQLLSSGREAHELAGRTAARAASLALGVQRRMRASREALAWQRKLQSLVLSLAEVVSSEERRADVDGGGIALAAESVRAGVDALPVTLRRLTVRPPSCFQAFDLDVADVRTLTAEFARAQPERSRPLLVAGVRTSGSYLAPLCAAILESEGYGDVRVLTLRPQHQLGRPERQLVRGLARRRGLALVLDDPPGSGRSVARTCDQLSACGLPRESIVLVLPLFDDRESLPSVLGRYPSVLLPFDRWAINAKLTSDGVRRAFERLVSPGVRITTVEPAPLEDRLWRRSHERRRFWIGLAEHGRERTTPVLVEGVGIGYFGEHALTVARALHDHVPEVFGLDGGCLFREWLPEESRSCPPGTPPPAHLVTAVARYVAARRERLPVPEDRTSGLVGESPVWEVVSRILSRAFGRGALPSRPLLVDGLAKRLLEVRHPSVVDGSTALSNWFDDERHPEGCVKIDFAKRSFWNLGLTAFDAVFDLAGAAVSSPSDATGDALRALYESLTGESIDDERWFLYELAQLWGTGRTRENGESALRREFARALQRYMARVFLADVHPSPDGPLCALDLDGVLETETLGFPGTTVSGAMALRALLAHGHRPVPVSGRSIDEVVDRCRSYGLAGGVAEYGAAVYTASSGETHVLLSAEESSLLARVRDALADHEHAYVDDAYRHAVRAFAVDRDGRRRALDREIAAACAAAGDPDRVQIVEGEGQTDFVVVTIDKGVGIRALASHLGATGGSRRGILAFAIGDTVSDLPMLREAELAFTPANADQAVRDAGVEVVSASYQAGLSVAVGRLIGHPPGACAICRAPTLSPETALLVSLLSVREGGRIELARRFLRLHRLYRGGG